MAPSLEHAAWTLTVAFGLSMVYELYRATARSGVSEHDSVRVFVREGVPLYVVSGTVIALMFLGIRWAAWLGLLLSVAGILVSITYYNPKIMLSRRPTLVDWAEDIVFTGLLFVAATQLVYVLAHGSLP